MILLNIFNHIAEIKEIDLQLMFQSLLLDWFSSLFMKDNYTFRFYLLWYKSYKVQKVNFFLL